MTRAVLAAALALLLTVRVQAQGLVADCRTDNAPALSALLTQAARPGGGGEVRVPAQGACYGLMSAVAVPSGVRLVGTGGPVFAALGRTGAMLSIPNAHDVTLRGLRLDSRSAAHPTVAMPIAVTGSGNVRIEDVELLNPTGEIHVVDSTGVTVVRPVVAGSLLHGVLFDNVRDGAVLDGRFQDEAGFGVILRNGSRRNLIQGNRTTANGIELVGITEDSGENRVIGNHAEGTGDNGISVTGWGNLVQGNTAIRCRGNGIQVFGENNTVVGNTVRDNAQGAAAQSGWRAGIAVRGGFGGVAQRNTVRGNTVDDDQPVPTQHYGIWVGRTVYQPWASGESVATGAYRARGADLYRALGPGTTGPRPPEGQGTAGDGGVTWRWVRRAPEGTMQNDRNEVSGNTVGRARLAACLDESGAPNNRVACGGR